jgi:hypothetical protein
VEELVLVATGTGAGLLVTRVVIGLRDLRDGRLGR